MLAELQAAYAVAEGKMTVWLAVKVIVEVVTGVVVVRLVLVDVSVICRNSA